MVFSAMVIKEHINVSDNRLLDGLVPVVRVMSQMEALKEGETVTIEELIPEKGKTITLYAVWK